MHHALDLIWFFLPAALANGAPVFLSKLLLLRKWNTSLDFGKTLGKKRIFGQNKTWRGLLGGTVVGAVTAWLLFSLQTPELANGKSFILLGLLLGAGALIGDAVKSFFKRRAAVKPGDSWIPFDQLDFVVGGIAASSLLIKYQISDILTLLIVFFLIHVLSVFVGYKLGIRSKPI